MVTMCDTFAFRNTTPSKSTSTVCFITIFPVRFVVVMVHAEDVLIDLKEVSVCALKLEPIYVFVLIH